MRTTIGLIAFVAIGLTAFIGLLVAWWQGITTRFQQNSAAWRRLLGLVALFGSSVQAFLFLAFEGAMVFEGDARYRRMQFASWAAANLCLFAMVLIAVIFGKGRFRFPALLSAAGMVVLWLLLGLAM